MIKRIVSYDFDGTMCFTPGHIEGEKIWKEKTSTDWPYTGWWSKKETLDLNIFDIPVNQFVYRKYLEDMVRKEEEKDTFVLLATGRLERLRKEVEKVLNYHNLSFDMVALNTGGDTYHFKTKLFEKLIREYNPEVFVMYDDRHEHLVKFEEWAKKQPCRVEIIDVTKSDKSPLIIN
jgi:hypothetical protein